ncbi:hypothetical protein F8M41_005532 [Gigaspora margarita]|uniref:Uncharacterized protein n=1 Tax=Gigaspora margarita TaxID=4874 RepID=A0A8H4A6T6_GIGMA|nr:hypothetical protein F8M41_005532 [Gigaspora margarita]
MKKIFTILLILAIVGLGLADKKRSHGYEPGTVTPTNTLPPTNKPGPTGTNTLPPTNKPGPTGTNTLPITNKPGPTGTNTLPPTDKPGPTNTLQPTNTNTLPPLPTSTSDPAIFKNLTKEFPRCNDVAISKAKDSIKQGCLADDVEKKHDPVAITALVGTALYTPIIESLCFTVSPNGPGFFFADSLARIDKLPLPPFKTPVFNNFTDKIVFAILGSIGIDQAKLTQFQQIIMIKCGFEFLTNNGTFPDLCPQSSQLKSRPRLGKNLKLTGGKTSN